MIRHLSKWAKCALPALAAVTLAAAGCGTQESGPAKTADGRQKLVVGYLPVT